MVDVAYTESRFRGPEIPHRYGDQIHLLDDPLAWSLLARACSPDTGQPDVGRLVRTLYEMLARAVLAAEFPRTRVATPTRMVSSHPEAVYRGLALDRSTKAVTVGIARAGTMPSQIVYELMNEVLDPALVRQDHLFMSRQTNEQGEVIGATWHDAKIGRDVGDRFVLFPDPMGATGSSIVSAMDYYKTKLEGRPARCISMHLIVTPEFVRRVLDAHPDAIVYALRLDRGLSPEKVLRTVPGTLWAEERGLNAIQYIVPGAGGVGEIQQRLGMMESMTEARVEPAELYGLKVLNGVSIASVEDMLTSCQVRLLAPGEVLLSQGQQNRTMYMLLTGRLSVHLESPHSEPVAQLGPGETVGELSVMDASPASAFVVAAEPTRLLAVDEPSFWSLVNASHDFAINLLLLLANRLRRNNSTVQSNIRLQREYKKNAMVDALTGLFNRRWLDEALPRFMGRYGKSGSPLSLLLLDVDHFKKFNDTYGHQAGDTVLSFVAHVLRHNVRPTDLAARYGGEEFVVILPDSDLSGARGAAERLRAAVEAGKVLGPDGAELPRVTISLGGAQMKAGATMAALLGEADEKLYEAKRTGRNRVLI